MTLLSALNTPLDPASASPSSSPAFSLSFSRPVLSLSSSASALIPRSSSATLPAAFWYCSRACTFPAKASISNSRLVVMCCMREEAEMWRVEVEGWDSDG